MSKFRRFSYLLYILYIVQYYIVYSVCCGSDSCSRAAWSFFKSLLKHMLRAEARHVPRILLWLVSISIIFSSKFLLNTQRRFFTMEDSLLFEITSEERNSRFDLDNLHISYSRFSTTKDSQVRGSALKRNSAECLEERQTCFKSLSRLANVRLFDKIGETSCAWRQCCAESCQLTGRHWQFWLPVLKLHVSL